MNMKQDSEPSENKTVKSFEFDIKSEIKRYKVRLLQKLEKLHLDDNRKIAEDGLVKLIKDFSETNNYFF